MNDCQTTMEYWDCDCEDNYIHKTDLKKTNDEQVCLVCGYTREDGADSRVSEVLASGIAIQE